MADYNVNMKQWNGTSFDNVLPLAYNAKNAEALAGSSIGDIQQWVKDNGLLLYTGQYTGTGTYGASNPTSITFPFEVIMFVPPQNFGRDYGSQLSTSVSMLLTSNLSNEYERIYFKFSNRDYLFMKISSDRKTISWYSDGDQFKQMNVSGSTYNFAAIGGYDMGTVGA